VDLKPNYCRRPISAFAGFRSNAAFKGALSSSLAHNIVFSLNFTAIALQLVGIFRGPSRCV